MRRFLERQRLLHFVAILGFVVGQWFAIIHATQHELSDSDTDGCQVCSLAHATGGAPAALSLPVDTAPLSEPPPEPAIETVALRPIARPRSRGPPLLFS